MIRTSGNTKSSEASSFYGLNAGVLVSGGARLTITGGSVSTTGSSANGVFAYGSGASSAAVATDRHTTLTGTIDTAALILDKTSTWKVTGNSTLTTLAGAQTSGVTITNIVGNGHTVTYRASLAANAKLHGKNYTLSGGGELRPA